ncbi:MAG: endonuclease/exonuclease/phosphatase family protein [Archangium sp.]|nr:endonuclease/exonuclease/phosphatase family protein [Archangium sp.]
MSLLRLATWNVHGCVGADGVENPERIASVIRELDPDIIGLQEMKEGALPRIAELTGLHAIAGVTRPEFQFGNALLTRHAVESVTRHDVSYRVREPRGVLDVQLRRAEDGARVRVLVTHFGLKADERRRQADLLLGLVQEPGAQLLAVLGDFNEWRPFVRTLHRLDAHLGPAQGVRSFPSVLPVFRLDRVWVSPHQSLLEVRAWRGRGAWRASDHLPVTALVELTPQPSP